MPADYTRVVRSLRAAYDGLAPLYERAFDRSSGHYADVGEDELQSMLALASPRETGSILDVACGTGRVAVRLEGRRRRVVGTDISAEMLRVYRGRQASGRRDLVVADALHLPFGPGLFDLVTCMGMFDYYADALIVAILSAFRTVLRGDGRIVFSVQNRDAARMTEYIAESEAELGTAIHAYRQGDLPGICERAGLRVVEQAAAGLQLHVVAEARS